MMSNSRRLNVLISAYACEPHKGSESAVGWNVAVHMSRHHDVWVLTRANNRKVIEAELGKHPVSGLKFFYYDLPGWAMWWKKGGRGVQLYYYLWELLSVRTVRKAEEAIRFDLVHHVTVVRYWTPTNLRRAKAPLVWGPIGGGESTPSNLKKMFSIKNRSLEWARDVVRRIGERDPLVRKTARKCAVALATTEETARRLRCIGASRVEVMSQLGMHLIRVAAPLSPNDRVRFICIGKQYYWKGFDLAIKAFARSSLADAELILVGEGPEHPALTSLVQGCGLEDRIQLIDWVEQKTLHELLSQCDVLVHPSFHDSGGFVCLEAMSMGKPVICLDLGGPAVQVTDETGIKVKAEKPDQILSDLVNAMKRLSFDSELRRKMGEAGRKRVEDHFLWEKKVKYLSEIYGQLIELTRSQ